MNQLNQSRHKWRSVVALFGILTMCLWTIGTWEVRSAEAQDSSQRGMVTLSFDDAWKDQYTSALPLLEEANMPATFYITTEALNPEKYSGFMTAEEVNDLYNRGFEIGSHTVNHVDLTAMNEEDLKKEINESKNTLEGIINSPVKTFAYPYGRYNENVIQALKDAGYKNARATDDGLNDDETNSFTLTSFSLERDTPLKDVEKAIQDAMNENKWLILTFHEINDSGREYSHSSSFLSEVINYLRSNNVDVVTVGEGFDRMRGFAENELKDQALNPNEEATTRDVLEEPSRVIENILSV